MNQNRQNPSRMLAVELEEDLIKNVSKFINDLITKNDKVTATGLEPSTTSFNHLAKLVNLCGCGFESCCSHLNLRFRTCFKQGVP